MSKQNFLLVDLNEKKTKKLAETITSDTSRKILNYLAEKEHDTEANMAKELNIPISTVHYHLQKLKEAKLVLVEEYHYSPKGREVNHYKLANKYIIIAPRKISGLKEKLRGILPVGLVVLGISAIIKLTQMFTSKASFAESKVMSAPVLESVAMDAGPIVEEAVLRGEVMNCIGPATPPDYSLLFLIGGVATIAIYILIILIKEWKRK